MQSRSLRCKSSNISWTAQARGVVTISANSDDVDVIHLLQASSGPILACIITQYVGRLCNIKKESVQH